MCTLILKVSCQQYTNLVLFMLFLIVISKFILIGQSVTKNLVFWSNFFFRNGYPLSFIDNSNVFCFKDCSPFDFVSLVVYKNMRGRCSPTYYGQTDRHLKVKSGEHNGMSRFKFKKIKPSKESAIRDHSLNCNNIPSFEEITILANKNSKFVLEIKERLLIK